jgi:hypothetical protein
MGVVYSYDRSPRHFHLISLISHLEQFRNAAVAFCFLPLLSTIPYHSYFLLSTTSLFLLLVLSSVVLRTLCADGTVK